MKTKSTGILVSRGEGKDRNKRAGPKGYIRVEVCHQA